MSGDDRGALKRAGEKEKKRGKEREKIKEQKMIDKLDERMEMKMLRMLGVLR